MNFCLYWQKITFWTLWGWGKCLNPCPHSLSSMSSSPFLPHIIHLTPIFLKAIITVPPISPSHSNLHQCHGWYPLMWYPKAKPLAWGLAQEPYRTDFQMETRGVMYTQQKIDSNEHPKFPGDLWDITRKRSKASKISSLPWAVLFPLVSWMLSLGSWPESP